MAMAFFILQNVNVANSVEKNHFNTLAEIEENKGQKKTFKK